MDTPAQFAPQSEFQPPPGAVLRRSTLRFSIREMLLLTTAVAAITALAIDRYRAMQVGVPSPWISTFGSYQHVNQIATRAGHNGSLYLSGGGGGGCSGGTTTRTFEYDFKLPPSQRGKLIALLASDARAMIELNGGRIRGTSRSGPPSDLRSFGFSYEGDHKGGMIEVRSISLPDNRMALLITIFERADEP